MASWPSKVSKQDLQVNEPIRIQRHRNPLYGKRWRQWGIRPLTNNIAFTRFEVFRTFLCVFMSAFRVIIRQELWEIWPVARFRYSRDYTEYVYFPGKWRHTLSSVSPRNSVSNSVPFKCSLQLSLIWILMGCVKKWHYNTTWSWSTVRNFTILRYHFLCYKRWLKLLSLWKQYERVVIQMKATK